MASLASIKKLSDSLDRIVAEVHKKAPPTFLCIPVTLDADAVLARHHKLFPGTHNAEHVVVGTVYGDEPDDYPDEPCHLAWKQIAREELEMCGRATAYRLRAQRLIETNLKRLSGPGSHYHLVKADIAAWCAEAVTKYGMTEGEVGELLEGGGISMTDPSVRIWWDRAMNGKAAA